MKTTDMLKYTLAILVGMGAATLAGAADTPATPATPAAPAQKPSREDIQKRVEEWNKLTPEQRKARMEEWQGKRKSMTPEERDAQRKVWRERMEKRIEELNKKKTDGTITADETKQLERMKQMLERWAQTTSSPATPAKPSDKPAEKKPEEKK